MATQPLEIIKRFRFFKKILCCFGLFQMSTTPAASTPTGDDVSPTHIRIYNGRGTNPMGNTQTHYMCQTFFPNSTVDFIGPDAVKTGEWKHSTWLFVIPGGRATPYRQELGDIGEDHIIDFVHKGGKLLGICAGAYYASSFVQFAEDIPALRVVTPHRLGFYPGISRGPAYKPFSYDTKIDALPVAVRWGSFSSVMYYNGGGYFQNSEVYTIEKDPALSILGRYEEEDGRIAVVHRRIAKGAVLLSHVHFEFDPFLEGFKNDFLEKGGRSKVLKDLQTHNEGREKFMRFLLQKIGGDRFIISQS